MNQLPLRVGVIGYGYWGPNLVRNFFAHQDSTVTMVADLSEENLHRVRTTLPGIQVTTNAEELVSSSEVDAVVIATPVRSHFPLALSALEQGKHTIIEKPITTSAAEAEKLIAVAEARQLVLMVDHTFVYTGAVRKMRQLIDSGELGDLYYFDSERINLGLLRHDVNVVWDLAPHDLSILEYLIDEEPCAVRARGYKHVGAEMDEMALVTIEYPSGFHAHIRVSWLSPVKMRLTMIGGSKKMIVYDDVQPSEKVRLYDKGIVLDFGDEEVSTTTPIYRAGDVHIPQLDRREALQIETQHFLDCVRHKKKPLTGGPEGLAVVRLLEAADRSMAEQGATIRLQ